MMRKWEDIAPQAESGATSTRIPRSAAEAKSSQSCTPYWSSSAHPPRASSARRDTMELASPKPLRKSPTAPAPPRGTYCPVVYEQFAAAAAQRLLRVSQCNTRNVLLMKGNVCLSSCTSSFLTHQNTPGYTIHKHSQPAAPSPALPRSPPTAWGVQPGARAAAGRPRRGSRWRT